MKRMTLKLVFGFWLLSFPALRAATEEPPPVDNPNSITLTRPVDNSYSPSIDRPSASSNTTPYSPAIDRAGTANPPPSPSQTTLVDDKPVTAERPAPEEVLKIMERVADWQLANPTREAKDGWIYAAFYDGVMALGRTSPDPKYIDAMLKQAQDNLWKPGSRIYHADDHAVTQMYLELYELKQDPSMIVPTRQRLDFVYSFPKDDQLDFTLPGHDDKWSWCDALFMAPPAWARLAKATGDQKYLDFANKRWWVTSDFLYDKDEDLYFRDSTYFNKREPNEKKIFWSRGNGWVLAGLARMMDYLPADYPDRSKYVRQFRQMAAKIKTLQQPDGLWRPGLLDPVAHPQREVSGTGFFVFALAWGINHDIIDRAEYEPVVFKGWNGLVQSVQPDGRLINVQPVGASPAGFKPDVSTPFGTGAFLLAGSEVYKLVGGKVPEMPKPAEAKTEESKPAESPPAAPKATP